MFRGCKCQIHVCFHFPGPGYVIQVWPVPSGGQGCWGLLGKFPFLHKKIQSKKATFFLTFDMVMRWAGVLGMGHLGAVALPPCSPAFRIFPCVRRCVFLFKLGFSSAVMSVLIYHPDALFPLRGLSLSLIDSGNSSFHQRSILKDPPLHGILKSTDERGTTWPRALPW